MKLDINDLTKGLTDNKVSSIRPIEPSTDFMTGFVQNVKQVMDVLDAMGVKDLFVMKAREELEGRLFRHRPVLEGKLAGKPSDNPQKGVNNPMLKPKVELDKILTLALVWLDRFIEKNGDMPLSQFRKVIEENKEQIIKSVKDIGLGWL